MAVTGEADVHEAIPIYLEKERNTQAYKDTMDIDIDKIDTFEIRNKVNTVKQRPIYGFTEEDYFKESGIFPDNLMKQCKDNANEYQFIPL